MLPPEKFDTAFIYDDGVVAWIMSGRVKLTLAVLTSRVGGLVDMS